MRTLPWLLVLSACAYGYAQTLPENPASAPPSHDTIRAAPLTANVRTDTLHVAGRCKHCKQRIESALRGVEGILSAEWDVRSKRLLVQYNPAVIDRRQIQERVAAAGHDTEEVKAADDAYAKLPKCCRYRSP